MPTRILIVYDSHSGNTQRMARLIARGVGGVNNCEAVLRRAAPVSDNIETNAAAVPETGDRYAQADDLPLCDGLIIGSPTHFGNMSAALKYFIDCSTPHWLSGALSGKPAAAFTSTGSMHGGQEMTLIGMLVPLLHHGMLLCGLPYSNPGLMQTRRGGTPYGASHVSGESGKIPLDDTEADLCMLLGQRVATLAIKLNTESNLS